MPNDNRQNIWMNNKWEENENDHTIQKVEFLSKNTILTKPQHFKELFTQIFFYNFSREIKVVNS